MSRTPKDQAEHELEEQDDEDLDEDCCQILDGNSKQYVKDLIEEVIETGGKGRVRKSETDVQ